MLATACRELKTLFDCVRTSREKGYRELDSAPKRQSNSFPGSSSPLPDPRHRGSPTLGRATSSAKSARRICYYLIFFRHPRQEEFSLRLAWSTQGRFPIDLEYPSTIPLEDGSETALAEAIVGYNFLCPRLTGKSHIGWAVWKCSVPFDHPLFRQIFVMEASSVSDEDALFGAARASKSISDIDRWQCLFDRVERATWPQFREDSMRGRSALYARREVRKPRVRRAETFLEVFSTPPKASGFYTLPGCRPVRRDYAQRDRVLVEAALAANPSFATFVKHRCLRRPLQSPALPGFFATRRMTLSNKLVEIAATACAATPPRQHRHVACNAPFTTLRHYGGDLLAVWIFRNSSAMRIGLRPSTR